MTEEDAEIWLRTQPWWTEEKGEKLAGLVRLVIEESQHQNLVSAATIPSIWARHVVDSAQLLSLAPQEEDDGLWVDLGTGAGFPGLVIAILRPGPMCMIEMRPLRTAFLQKVVDDLGLGGHAEVRTLKTERTSFGGQFAQIISARAYAPLGRLFKSAQHFSNSSTVWLLPKGRNAQNELEIARKDWQAMFHVEQSITSDESFIVTATRLGRRGSSPRRSGRRRI